MLSSTWGLIVASGKTEQMSTGADTAFLSFGTDPVLAYSVQAFEQSPEIDGIAIVIPKDRADSVKALVRMYGCTKVKKLIPGFSQRHTSVQAGLKALEGEASVVVIHEASRPCIKHDLVSDTVKSAKRYGSGLAAAMIEEPVLLGNKGKTATKAVDAPISWRVMSPQAYKMELILKAFEQVKKKKLSPEDESEAFGLLKEEIRLVPCPSTNVKVITPDDLALVTALLKM